jgi:oligopeptide/dipeptide ABC transporter ATP-binding protein
MNVNHDELIRVKGLSVKFKTDRGEAYAVRNVNFAIKPNETLGLVGESGSGKSVTAQSILKLHPSDRTKIAGEISYKGQNLLDNNEKEMQKIRGNQISMIFQDPMISLNPVIRVGEQISETIRYHKKISRKEAMEQSIRLINEVGIPFAEERYHQYPHEFSGGMLQRFMIAIALSCNPNFLIADEPTTALDVTVQAQILRLMKKLQKDFGMSILIITHNLGIVSEICDHVAVMYAGELVEISDVIPIFSNPLHPYTYGLLEAIPVLGQKHKKLKNIEGHPPNIFDHIQGCNFSPRCPFKTDICLTEKPILRQVGNLRYVACHNPLNSI